MVEVKIIKDEESATAFIKGDIDHHTAKEIREQINAENKLVIGTIGRLSAQKNQVYLLDIFKEVYKKICVT